MIDWISMALIFMGFVMVYIYLASDNEPSVALRRTLLYGAVFCGVLGILIIASPI